MEEKWLRDPLSGVLLALGFIGYGFYLALASLGHTDWDNWWAYLILAIGIPLAIEFPIRFLSPRYLMRGGPFSRQLIGVALICIGIGGIFGFEEWWPALMVIALGWAILTFSIWRLSTPRRRR